MHTYHLLSRVVEEGIAKVESPASHDITVITRRIFTLSLLSSSIKRRVLCDAAQMFNDISLRVEIFFTRLWHDN